MFCGTCYCVCLWPPVAWLAQEFTEKIIFSSGTHYYAVLSRQLPTSFMNLINLNVVSPELWRIPVKFSNNLLSLPQDWENFTFVVTRPSSFFSPFSFVRPTQIFGIFKRKKKCNYVVEPFFTWNNSFNLKNEHSNSLEKNRNKNMNIFYSILCILLIQICEC